MPTPNPVSHADHRRLAALAQTLAERRSASNSYVNVKVSAQGAIQPEVNVTPDTTQEDIDRMTALAISSVTAIMAESPEQPPKAEKAKTVHIHTKAAK